MSDLSSKLEDEACDIECAGNKNQTCGGSLKLDVYTPKETENGAVSLGPRSAAILTAMVALTAYLAL